MDEIFKKQQEIMDNGIVESKVVLDLLSAMVEQVASLLEEDSQYEEGVDMDIEQICNEEKNENEDENEAEEENEDGKMEENGEKNEDNTADKTKEIKRFGRTDNYEALEYRRLICYWCDKRFPKYHNLKIHIATHVESKRKKCTLCEKSFTQTSSLTIHMLSHTGEKPHKCHLCPKSFITAGKLKRHIRSHTGEKRYECDICHMRFTAGDSMRKHRERCVNASPRTEKTKTKIIQCSFCEAGFTRKEDWKLHKKEVHNIPKEPPKSNEPNEPKVREGDHACHLCGKNFAVKKYLAKHLKRHEQNTKGFQCKQCNHHFNTRRELATHTASEHPSTSTANNPEPEHRCPVCNITFKYRYFLKKHLTLHTNSRPYKCPQCDGTYKSQNDLHRHSKIHQERLHKCPDCGKGFVASTDLKRHYRIHTGAKPYICEVCHQGFSQSTSLRKHKEKKHPYGVQEEENTRAVNDLNNLTTVQEILNWIGQQPSEPRQVGHYL